ncbi:hypothetical protein GE09DRAFT_1130076 [Coniochaeta sp. 2T2.1]|nr:hypothetical protein GE09DRAFT_1130076 [Coniochaeta sp. 2T2.1]
MKSEGLKLAWHLLPATIKDSMLLCRILGVRYLWVDALCFLQDDERDVTNGVNNMDQVYELSWLTIIAACGHNAAAGLPGVRSGNRLRAEAAVEVKPGISLGLLMPFDKPLERSVYSIRA